MKIKLTNPTSLFRRYLASKLWIVMPEGHYFVNRGYCMCCDKKVKFYARNNWFRDSYICTICSSLPRERALMKTIEKYFPEWRSLKIHESSPSNRGASAKLKREARNYTPSQYFPNQPFGSKVENFINQDLENQTFEDESFDIVVTQDVLEHVYDPKRAFSEIARTLKKGGAHIFTVPLVNKFRESEVWAVKGENGEPVFTNTPEWHGNPINKKGAPVTMHWGFDIVDFIGDSSNLKTIIEYFDDLSLGIRGEYIEVLVSLK